MTRNSSHVPQGRLNADSLRSLLVTFSLLGLSVVASANADDQVGWEWLSSASVSTEVHLRVDNNTALIGEAGEDLQDVNPYRFRLTPQIDFQLGEKGSFKTRARAEYRSVGGSDSSDVFMDTWLYQFAGDGYVLSAGRGSLPFWTQNDLFWSGDVTPMGVFASKDLNADSVFATLSAGYFELPHGKNEFDDQMAAFQAYLIGSVNEVDWTIAAGGYFIDSDSSSDAYGGFDRIRDYSIANMSFKAEADAGGQPVSLGIDLYKNLTRYDGDSLDGEDFGFLATASWKANDELKFGYTYARVEALSVSTPYAEGDWVRFGSGSHPVGMQGHGFQAIYSFAENQSFMGYVFLRDVMDSLQEATRYRFEYNASF
ncbi:hypothetical protein VDG1235_3324 [Verrucomicrobiia bacterium DG1235]|nr:hypothetical protein VDG1235_3324 [Verrucomicrobiae bacterium DG1235]